MTQKQCGVDVLLFVMYTTEYDGDCRIEANRNKAYISYIDSTPLYKTSGDPSGSERSRVFQDLILAYFDFIRHRGFTHVIMWSCAPEQGMDYVLSCKHIRDICKGKVQCDADLLSWYSVLVKNGHQKNILSSPELSTFKDAFDTLDKVPYMGYVSDRGACLFFCVVACDDAISHTACRSQSARQPRLIGFATSRRPCLRPCVTRITSSSTLLLSSATL